MVKKKTAAEWFFCRKRETERGGGKSLLWLLRYSNSVLCNCTDNITIAAWWYFLVRSWPFIGKVRVFSHRRLAACLTWRGTSSLLWLQSCVARLRKNSSSSKVRQVWHSCQSLCPCLVMYRKRIFLLKKKDKFHVHTTFVIAKYLRTRENESNSCSNKHVGTCSFCRQDFKTQTIDTCYLFIVIWHLVLHFYLFKTILALAEQCQSSEKKSSSLPLLRSCQELHSEPY